MSKTILDRDAIRSYLNKFKGWEYNDLENFIDRLQRLQDALDANRSVFAICEKRPKGNLDTGRHYYSVWYVNDAGVIMYFHIPRPLWKQWGVKFPDNYSRPSFYSGAIGMSRLLAATDVLFAHLREWGGTYTQIACL